MHKYKTKRTALMAAALSWVLEKRRNAKGCLLVQAFELELM